MSEKVPCTAAAPEKLTCRQALVEIRKILSDPNRSDSACIEAICRVFETLPDMPEADCPPQRH